MVKSLNEKLDRLMSYNSKPDVLSEIDDLQMIDSLITESTQPQISEFKMSLSSLKKELLESSDVTILKAAARNLRDVLNPVDLPATSVLSVATAYGTHTAELLNMFESLYGSISSFHTRLTELQIAEDIKIEEQRILNQSKQDYKTLAGIKTMSVYESDIEIDEKVKKAHHAYPQSAHDWVSIRVEELYPDHIKDKGEAYGRAWNEYKSKH